jgi:branched-chain amino acid transport system permease protein
MLAPVAAADVSVSFDGLRASSNVALALSRGRARGLISPNGAGEAARLEAVAGMVKPSRGEAKSEGMRIDERSPKDIARLCVSQDSQGREVFTSLTADENARVGVGMRARRESPAGALSGGRSDRGRVGDALHASSNRDAQVRDSGGSTCDESLRATRACRENGANSAIEGGSP